MTITELSELLRETRNACLHFPREHELISGDGYGHLYPDEDWMRAWHRVLFLVEPLESAMNELNGAERCRNI